jgi:hypothetical protein
MIWILFDVFEKQDRVWEMYQSVGIPHSDNAPIVPAYKSYAVARELEAVCLSLCVFGLV